MKLNTQRDKEVWNRSRKDAIDEILKILNLHNIKIPEAIARVKEMQE